MFCNLSKQYCLVDWKILHGFSRGHSMQEVACETNAVKVKKALFILCCHVKTGSLLKKHWWFACNKLWQIGVGQSTTKSLYVEPLLLWILDWRPAVVQEPAGQPSDASSSWSKVKKAVPVICFGDQVLDQLLVNSGTAKWPEFPSCIILCRSSWLLAFGLPRSARPDWREYVRSGWRFLQTFRTSPKC